MPHRSPPVFIQGTPPALGGAPLLALALALTSTVPTSAAAQQQVYRSVDAQGNTIYSSEPPAGVDIRGVETVEIQPGPSEADRQAAEARARAIQQAADAYAQRRQAAREAAAEQEPAAADSNPPRESATADQRSDLSVNDRTLTPAQRRAVEKARQELFEARQRGSGGGGRE